MNIICPHCGAESKHRSVDLPMGQALQTLYGGIDPALAKIDYEARNATPQPASSRQDIAALRARVLAQRANPITPKIED